MAFRFRKRIKIIPGVYVNISKSGVSTTIGARGASINVGKRGSYFNLGIPGSGISYRHRLGSHRKDYNKNNPGLLPTKTTLSIKPNMNNKTHPKHFFFDRNRSISVRSSSERLTDLKSQIESSRPILLDTKCQLNEACLKSQQLHRKRQRKDNWFFRLLGTQDSLAVLDEEILEMGNRIVELKQQYEDAKVCLDIVNNPDSQKQQEQLSKTFRQLCNSSDIWDVTEEKLNTETKSSAYKSVERKPVHFGMSNLEFINTGFEIPYLENANGRDLYLYPGFVVQINHKGDILITDYSDITFDFYKQRFLENENTLPSDAEVVDHTWARVNKDGSPDRRFVDNYLIPVVLYGAFEFTLPGCPKETYHISNVDSAEKFAKAFGSYLAFFNQASRETEDITPSTHSISDDTIELLRDISGKIVSLRDTLMDEPILCDNFSNGIEYPYQHTLEVTTSLLLYDLTHILKRMNPQKEDFMYFIIFYIMNNLLTNAGGVPESNAEFRRYYDLLDKTVTRDIVMGFWKGSGHPFTLTSNDENIRFTLNTALSLPPFLQYHELDSYQTYKNTIYNCAVVLAKADGTVSKQEEKVLKKLYAELEVPIEILEQKAPLKVSHAADQTLEQILQELHALTGLESVKEEVSRLINFIKVQQAREEAGLKTTPISYHMIFTGNPGTGKTTVARIVSKIYKSLGILSSGHLIEVDRSGLIAGYVGQTAAKVNAAVDSALHGVLFIDEAYALANDSSNDYGKEAVSTLIKRMEDDRDKLVVIFAGYRDEMQSFMDTNPGFYSRVNRFLDFKDYDVPELQAIFMAKCQKLDYHMCQEAVDKLYRILSHAVQVKDDSFGNARFVRNLFEKTLEEHANRVASEANLTKERLTTILAEDIKTDYI